MSVVIGLKHNDVVYMACDSQSSSNMKKVITHPSNFKVKPINGLTHSLVGHVGSAVASRVIGVETNIIKKKDLENKKMDYRYVVQHLVPKLFELQEKYQYHPNKNFPRNLEGAFLFAHHDKLFMIRHSDAGVTFEVENYCAIGSGEDLAFGSLMETENSNMTPTERLIQAVKVASYGRYVDFPVIIANTKDKSYVVVTDNEDYIKTAVTGGLSWD